MNPVVGATYKITPTLTAYAGYSEANRAPTPLELACSDPLRPCLIDSALVADPPLQVRPITMNWGSRESTSDKWQVGLGNAGAFHTRNIDDIITVASPIPGHQFFQNGGTTLRQGFEASAKYKQERWNVYANYTFVDATFQTRWSCSHRTIRSLMRPGIFWWFRATSFPPFPSIGSKLVPNTKSPMLGRSGQTWLLLVVSTCSATNLTRTRRCQPIGWSMRTRPIRLQRTLKKSFGLIQNLFNQRYYTFGTFFETDLFPYLNLSDPRTFLPSMPFAAYAGVRVGKIRIARYGRSLEDVGYASLAPGGRRRDQIHPLRDLTKLPLVTRSNRRDRSRSWNPARITT